MENFRIDNEKNHLKTNANIFCCCSDGEPFSHSFHRIGIPLSYEKSNFCKCNNSSKIMFHINRACMSILCRSGECIRENEWVLESGVVAIRWQICSFVRCRSFFPSPYSIHSKYFVVLFCMFFPCMSRVWIHAIACHANTFDVPLLVGYQLQMEYLMLHSLFFYIGNQAHNHRWCWMTTTMMEKKTQSNKKE